MPWNDLFKRKNARTQDLSPTTTTPAPVLPPHMQRIVEERQRPAGPPPDAKAKLARLERNRMAILFDIEQGELAAAPDNPWKQRIALLTESMKTVDDDVAVAKVVQPGPYAPVPATPIRIGEIQPESPASVAFAVGEERFVYTEDRDWAERGHTIAQSELKLREGSIDALVPASTLADQLRAHLAESLFVFASDLRDRVLDGEPLPETPTLADLARPCPVCGGWMDWKGRCQNCRNRDVRLQELKREGDRLLSERAREAEEQHRLVERLPIARRRLRDIDVEIAALRRDTGLE